MDAAVVLTPNLHEIENEVAERLHVFQILGREPNHRVKLDFIETARESVFGGIVHVLIADGLVDHLADAFGTCFGSERRTAASLECCHFFGETLSEAIDADARKADIYVIVKRVVDDRICKRFDWLVVCGRKRQKAQFAFACRLNTCFGNVQNIVRIEFAAWPVPNACLAETATLSATAHHFDAKAVVDKLHICNQVFYWMVFRIEIRYKLPTNTIRFFVGAFCGFFWNDDAKFVLDNIAEAWNVNAIDFGQIF